MLFMRLYIWKLRFIEFLKHDSWLATRLISLLLFFLWRILSVFKVNALALRYAGAVHRSHHLKWACSIIESWLASNIKRGSLCNTIELLIANETVVANARKYEEDPSKLIGSRILVLKKPINKEKGVVVFDYSHLYTIALRHLDFDELSKRYYIVLEPSWVGLCTIEILGFAGRNYPVFVQTAEPADIDFINSLKSNLIPIPIAANWWVDHRVFTINPSINKDNDVITIGAWTSYKRHYRIFSALAALRRKNTHIKAICIGYPSGWDLNFMKSMARYYGVDDQVQFYERLDSAEINTLLNRSRVNIIWSHKEGSNRAIIEGMCANVPCLLKNGFNYGYHYSHINSCTGIFSDEVSLGYDIINICNDKSNFDPRNWIINHMSCQHATRILSDHLRNYATMQSEPWSTDCVPKISGLHNMEYWDLNMRDNFIEDHSWIKSKIKAPVQ